MDERKLNLLKWLENNISDNVRITNLQKQKFLFFYEMFQIIDDLDYNIDYLKAYKNGPVFSNIYGFQRYDNNTLSRMINSVNNCEINTYNAKSSLYIVLTMTDKELSDCTHKLELWNSKKELIDSGAKQIPITIDDITNNDKLILKKLKDHTLDISDFKILTILDKIFLFNLEDYEKLDSNYDEILELLSRDNELINPVFVNIDSKGVLLVD